MSTYADHYSLDNRHPERRVSRRVNAWIEKRKLAQRDGWKEEKKPMHAN